jgi:hypothetical protein
MLRFLRRVRATTTPQVTFCDGCSQVCTATCAAEARRERVHAAVWTHTVLR